MPSPLSSKGENKKTRAEALWKNSHSTSLDLSHQDVGHLAKYMD
jgi:hypothetical protein